MRIDHRDHSLVWALRKMGQLGIINIGATAYDSYPQAVVAPTITSSVTPYTLGVATTLIAAAGITPDFYATHLAWVLAAGATNGNTRAQIRTLAGQDRRSVGARLTTSTSSYPVLHQLAPYRFAGGSGVDIVSSSEVGGQTQRAYLEVLKVEPEPMPSLMRADPTAASALFPTTSAGTSINSAAGAGTYTAVPVQITASVGAASVLIYSVQITSAAAVDLQVSVMTGAGGAEVEWGVFGMPRSAGVALLGVQYILPFPVLVPATTRLAARVRNNTTGAAVASEVGIGYVPLPLY